MAAHFIPWGEAAHSSVVESLPWPDNAKLACCNRAFHEATIDCNSIKDRIWWGQTESTSRDVETLVASLVEAKEVLSPSARPNFAMFLIDSDVLLSTTVRDLCGRLHSSNLVPLECPIFVVESDAGVFGASVSGEGGFSKYVGRDVELDPTAPVTAVLTVAHIPPEEGGDGSVKPRVKCFVVDDTPQNRRNRSKNSVDGVAPVVMECAPTVSRKMNLGRAATGGRSSARSAAIRNRGNAAAKAIVGGSSATAAGAGFDTRHPGNDETMTHKGPAGSTGAAEGSRSGGDLGTPRGAKEAQPRRQSRRASTMARSRSASRRALFELSPPSASVPLEDADTVFLVGDHPFVLNKTTAWMEKLLPGATILGGISSCALVIADQVFPSDKLRGQSWPAMPAPRVVGVALRGVHALAVSAKGFEGVGPVFRVDTTVDEDGIPQNQPGSLLRDVTILAERGGAGSRQSNAMSVFYEEVPLDPVWGGNNVFNSEDVYLSVSSSPSDLIHFRSGSGDEGAEEARGAPPLDVSVPGAGMVGVSESVSPGEYARFMHRSPHRVLEQTEATYRSCKRRIEKEGSVVLSSINFTCSVRPDRLELTAQQGQQPQQAGEGEDETAPCVVALHQQEMVRFCRTLNVPAAGVFCNGELGPVATLISGIFPRSAKSVLQGYTTCAAVLCWNPNPVGTGEQPSSG